MLDDEKYWIKQGSQVAHRDNIKQKMWVEEKIFKFKEVEIDKKLIKKKVLLGIRCHWWNNDGGFVVGKFHSHELLPWDIAKGGIKISNKWIAERGI